MLSINEGTNAMRDHFHTKKRQCSPPESTSQTRTSTLHVCPFRVCPQRSLCLNLNQKDMMAIPQVQMRTSQTEKRLCETTSLAKHRGERVNGSVGLQSQPMSKPTEWEYGYRTHNGTSIKPRSTT